MGQCGNTAMQYIVISKTTRFLNNEPYSRQLHHFIAPVQCQAAAAVNSAIRILYAEGDCQAATHTQAHFSLHAPDIDLQIVATGAACLEQVQRKPPDLLLLDLLLPGNEDMALLTALLRLTPTLPVVLMTDDKHSERIVSALHLGAAHYVPKRGDYLGLLPELLRTILAEQRRKQSQGALGIGLLRILYVDHAPSPLPLQADSMLTLHYLAQAAPHFLLDVIHNYAEAMVHLTQSPGYDLVLIDLCMAGHDGLDFLRSTQYRGRAFPPFIMITDTANEAIALAALKLGATEYIVKRDGYLKQLVAQIERTIANRRLHSSNGKLRLELFQHHMQQEVAEIKKIELEMQNETLRCSQIAQELAFAHNLTLYQQAPIGCCSLNLAGLIVESNLLLASLLRITQGALVNLPFTQFILAEDQNLFYFLKIKLRNSHAQNNKECIPLCCELRIVRSDGSLFTGELTISAIVDEGGADGVRLALSDISERHQIETLREQADGRMSFALNASRTGTWNLNLATHFAWHSLVHDRIFGYDQPLQEWSYPIFLSHVLPEDQPEVERLFKLATSTLSDWDFECRIRRADGEIRWIRACGDHQKDSLDIARYQTGIVQDITPRKQAELALQASLQEKTALLNEVHHRVKNNLQLISSLLRLERGRCAEPETKSLLNDMQGRIQAMALLHETLYSSGTFATVDLASYIRQLATQAFRSLQPEPGNVRLEFDVVSTRVGIDQATPCGLLLNELISNALKHGFPDGRTGAVHITLGTLTDTAMVRICVSDSGVGLPADFETRRGLSLGLRLVSNLAKQIGGALVIGPGATFTVTFQPETASRTRSSP